MSTTDKLNLRKQGFSRVDLLTVLFVIFFACSILVPVSARVKEVSKKNLCMYQLGAMGQLVTVFAAQNDDELPLVSDSSFVSSSPDSATDYYSYFQTMFPNPGPNGLGWLWKQGLIESGSDLPFCPELQRLFGNPMPALAWNARGNPNHWNYCGPPGGSYRLAPQDYNIGWINLRLSHGIRKLYKKSNQTGYKTITAALAAGKRAFLSDLWASSKFGPYWQTRKSDIPHQTGDKKSINVWYLDGHVENRIMLDSYFATGDVGILLPSVTWSNMFDPPQSP